MRFLLSFAGFLLTLPSLIILLLTGSLFFYSGKIFRSQMLKSFGLNLVYAADLLANALLLGSPNETISTRAANALRSGHAKWWVYPLSVAIDWLAFFVAGEKDHIKNAPDLAHPTKELWPWKD